MAPALSFDVLKRVGSPLAAARVPLLSPHRNSAPPDASPAASPPCLEASGAISPPVQAAARSAAAEQALPASPRTVQSALDREGVEGVMAVQLKRHKKRLLPAAKASYFVVSDAANPVLEIYASETRAELVFLLSLAGAELSFEADNANIVMEKCFCVDVKTWKRKNTVYFKHQGFIFFEEDQARMLLWVKCIHSAIKKAATVDGELFRRSTTANSPSSHPLHDYERLDSICEDESDEDTELTALTPTARDALCASSSIASDTSASASEKTRLLRGLSIDTDLRSSTATSPHQVDADAVDDVADIPSSSSDSSTVRTIYREPRTPLDRFNSIFVNQKQYLQRFPRSPAGSRAYSKTLPSSFFQPQSNKSSKFGARIASNLQTRFAESSGAWGSFGSPTSPQRLESPDSPPPFLRRRHRADGDRTDDFRIHPLSPPPTSGSRDSVHVSSVYAEVSHALSPTRIWSGLRKSKTLSEDSTAELKQSSQSPSSPSTKQATKSDTPDLSTSARGENSTSNSNEQHGSLTLQRFVVLVMANFAGAYQMSIFLPLASVGLFVHLFRRDELFVQWVCASIAVYLGSCMSTLLGACFAFCCVYLWSYSEFLICKRAKRNAEFSPQKLSREDVANIALPNWMAHPDVDRVNWLNDVFVTGWPYLKVAIRDSILNSLNPVLDAQRPAFISSLSISRIELGDRTPQISGVKFVATNALRDEVTIDIALRIVTDDSFTAELKLVTNLGATATMSLRDLFLVGTLRLTLTPLIGEWPCFSGLSLSFTSRPVFDFSLTAAKINLANVPFASEWLQSFLHDLLVSYFVWPKVLHIPLWEDAAVAST